MRGSARSFRRTLSPIPRMMAGSASGSVGVRPRNRDRRPTSVIGRRGVQPGDLERLARVRLDGEPAKKRQRTMESFLSSPKLVC